jgi:ferric-dicitrate binding protein FerR (iron transport regulator)
VNELIKKYFDGEMNQTQRLIFLREVEINESLKQAFVEYRNILGLISLQEHPDDEHESHEDYLHFMKKHTNTAKKIQLFRIVKYVAIAAVLMISSWMVSFLFYGYESQSDITENILQVPAGQRASIMLSDGTEIWLNAKSTLVYPSHFGKDARRVKITGEAYFNVTKDDNKPFIVSTNGLVIKVLGTVFNVCGYTNADSSNISLLEGAIEIYKSDDPKGKIRMKPNEQLNYKNGIMSISNHINEDDFLWRKGIYAFEKEKFSEIVKKLELYYDSKIIINNPRIANYEYTGKFRQRDGVEGILHVIQQIHKFKIKKDETNNIIILE